MKRFEPSRTYVVSVAPRLGAHRRRVRARAGLGERVRRERLARGDPRQEPLLLLLAPRELERRARRAPARRGSGRSSRRPSRSPRSRRASCSALAPTPPYSSSARVAEDARSRERARRRPTGTRPTCRSRPPAGAIRSRASVRTRSRISRCSAVNVRRIGRVRASASRASAHGSSRALSIAPETPEPPVHRLVRGSERAPRRADRARGTCRGRARRPHTAPSSDGGGSRHVAEQRDLAEAFAGRELCSPSRRRSRRRRRRSRGCSSGRRRRPG